jgi:hypothetical protein
MSTNPSMKSFYQSLQEELTSDTGSGSLVTLLSHSESTPRILRSMPQVDDRAPCLTFLCDYTEPFVDDADVSGLMESLVVFGVWDQNPVNCMEIADRLVYLILSGTMCSSPSNKGLNITNPSLSIVNLSTRLKSRDELKFSDEYDIWGSLIRCVFRWYKT